MMNVISSNAVPTQGQRPDQGPCERNVVWGVRVLVVDDEWPIRMLLTRILKAWGYGVRHVGDAGDALDVMAAEPADIVLCDVKMPERDGLWLVEQLRARWPGTAIIMSTADDDAHTVQASRKLGAVAYVTKPFVTYCLREALDRAIDVRRQYRSTDARRAQ